MSSNRKVLSGDFECDNESPGPFPAEKIAY